MYSDFEYYRDVYKGSIIPIEEYDYYAERASDQLAPYAEKSVFKTDSSANEKLKKCSCRISEILYSANGSKTGKSVTSESVNGYYSVTYATVTQEQVSSQINSAIRLYLGGYILGARRVMW